ncbi:hypothetical protein E2C01_089853 [Portunus trituberculatus]|uniref:Uncharacterized protein n=1 Tax=Portunus trituberculatus TaxID=210409 RepID=A0A5B7JQR3_PORTR|nr:hypothetical protein [Portunus trituberculatus]
MQHLMLRVHECVAAPIRSRYAVYRTLALRSVCRDRHTINGRIRM